jgi:hypothetical protein
MYTVDELAKLYASPKPPNLYVIINKDTPGAVKDPRREQWLYAEDPKATRLKTIVRDENALTPDNIANLKKFGIKEVMAYEPFFWDLVCEELCGQGHAKMQGQLFVLDSEEYNKRFEGGRSLNAPTTKPSNMALAK